MLAVLAVVGAVGALVIVTFALRVHISKQSAIEGFGITRLPHLLAICIGLGAAVTTGQIFAAVLAITGIPYRYLLEFRAISSILFSSVNGVAVVAATKYLAAAQYLRATILVSALIYLDVFGGLLAWTLYTGVKADYIDDVWSKILYNFFYLVGSSVRRGVGLVVVFSEVFLSLFCSLVAAHVPVQVLSAASGARTRDQLKLIIPASAALGIAALLLEWVSSKFDGYWRQFVQVVAQVVVAGFSVLLALFAATAYGASAWAAFLSGAPGGALWAFLRLWDYHKPSGVSGSDYLLARVLEAVMLAIAYVCGIGTIAFASVLLYTTKSEDGQYAPVDFEIS